MNPSRIGISSRALRSLTMMVTLGVVLTSLVFNLGVAHASPGGPQFTHNLKLSHAPGTGLNNPSVSEPSIRTSSENDTYVVPIEALPNGCDFYYVHSDGAGADFRGKSDAGAGGGDCDLATSARPLTTPPGTGHDVVAASSLTLGNITTSASFDRGVTWAPNPAGQQTPSVDREWNVPGQASNPLEFFMIYRQYPASPIFVAKSVDGGLSYTQTGSQINPPTGGTTCCSYIGGNMVVDPLNSNNMWAVFLAAPAAGGLSLSEVWLATSTDGGTTWINNEISAPAPSGRTYYNGFPNISMDAAGRLYVTYDDGANVYFASSDRATATSGRWAQQTVPTMDGTQTNLWSWIAAGPAGIADVVWLGTSDATTDTVQGGGTASSTWNVYFARYTDSANPALSRVSDHVIHLGKICVMNQGCTGNTTGSNPRTLGDFFQNSIGPDGVAHVAWADDSDLAGQAHAYVAQSIPNTVQSPSPSPVLSPAPSASPSPLPSPTSSPGPSPSPSPTGPPTCSSLYTDPAGNAPNGATGGDGLNMDQLDILSGAFGNRTSSGFTARMVVKNLALTIPTNGTGISWRSHFASGTTTYWVGAAYDGAPTPTLHYQYGTYTTTPTNGIRYSTVGSTTGSVVTGPNGIVDVNVDLAQMGLPATGSLSKTLGITYLQQTVNGSGALSRIDIAPKPNADGSFNYGPDWNLGDTCVLGSGTAAAGLAVTAVAPTSGTTAGGTSVTISGTGFVSGSAVRFGSTAAAAVTFINSTSLTATTPAEPAGSVDVVVTNPGGASSALSPGDRFNFVAPAPPPTGCVDYSSPANNAPNNALAGDGRNVDQLDLVDVSMGRNPAGGALDMLARLQLKNLQPVMPTNASWMEWVIQFTYTNSQGSAIQYFASATYPSATPGGTYDYQVGTVSNGSYSGLVVTSGSVAVGRGGTISISIPNSALNQNAPSTTPAQGESLTAIAALTFIGHGAVGTGSIEQIDVASAPAGTAFAVGTTCVAPAAAASTPTVIGSVSANGPVTAGSSITLSASGIQDQWGNTAADGSPVTFTATDPRGTTRSYGATSTAGGATSSVSDTQVAGSYSWAALAGTARTQGTPFAVNAGSAAGSLATAVSPSSVNAGQSVQVSVTGARDQYGNTVADGTQLVMSTTHAGVQVDRQSASTSNGAASFVIPGSATTGTGSYTVSTTSGTASGSATLTVLGTSSAAGTFAISAADGTVGQPVLVRATGVHDAAGNAVADGTQVVFSINPPGCGSAACAITLSGPTSGGTATATLAGSASTKAGTYSIAGSSGAATGGGSFTMTAGTPAGTFNLSAAPATVTAGAPVTLTASGMQDGYGNPAGSGSVAFTVTDPRGGASVYSAPVSQGTASTQLTGSSDGSAGTYAVSASSSGATSAAAATFTVNAGVVRSQFQITAPDVSAGSQVPVTADLTDTYGNPVSNVNLSLSVSQGGRVLASYNLAVSNGRASVTLPGTLTQVADLYAVVGRVPGSSGSAHFNVSPLAPSRIGGYFRNGTLRPGGSQTVYLWSEDRYGNLVPQQVVFHLALSAPDGVSRYESDYAGSGTGPAATYSGSQTLEPGTYAFSSTGPGLDSIQLAFAVGLTTNGASAVAQ